MSTKKERRDWIMVQLDELLTDLANQVESNGMMATEVVVTDKDRERLVTEIREIALAAKSGHVTFRLGEAKKHRELESLGRTVVGAIKQAIKGPASS